MPKPKHSSDSALGDAVGDAVGDALGVALGDAVGDATTTSTKLLDAVTLDTARTSSPPAASRDGSAAVTTTLAAASPVAATDTLAETLADDKLTCTSHSAAGSEPQNSLR
jgi:hypothetical protein